MKRWRCHGEAHHLCMEEETAGRLLNDRRDFEHRTNGAQKRNSFTNQIALSDSRQVSVSVYGFFGLLFVTLRDSHTQLLQCGPSSPRRPLCGNGVRQAFFAA